MTVPNLRRRMVLETPQRVPDGAGGFVEGWQALGEVWAQVTQMPGREVAGGLAALSQSGLRIVLRAAPVGSAMRPRPDQRLREDNRIFTILAVSESDPAGRYLTCLTREEVAR